MSYPKVHIVEECLREGMQIESSDIPVADKVRLLEALSDTGLRTIYVGSFVSPRYTPQMARIDEVVSTFRPVPGVRYLALALNEKGRERARAFSPPLSVDSGNPLLACHLCDTFSRRNANCSQADEIARWPAIVQDAVARGVREAAIGVNAVWGSNFEGPYALSDAMEKLEAAAALWQAEGIAVKSVLLGDPMSWCMPHRVEETLQAVLDRWPDVRVFHLHLHNARGMALPSMYAALRVLDERHEMTVETSAGGIGGCPYCGNGRSTGMAPTEDLVVMLEEMGIETGVDIHKLIGAVWLLEEMIGRASFGHVSKAGPLPRGDNCYDPNMPFVETFEEARHFIYGPDVYEHQIRPWRERIPSGRRPSS